MNNGWKRVSIRDVCGSIVDCLNRTAPKVEKPTPYKMIRTTNVKSGFIDLSEVKYVTKEVFDKWTRRSVPKKGDVILTREAPLGEVGMLRTNMKVFLGQRLVQYRADPSKLNNKFLLYSLKGRDLQEQIKAFGSGSTVEHMRVPDAKKLTLFLPPLKTQHKIASILSLYDDLIENNNFRINILKKTAKTIFDEWFVKYRFPGHEQIKMIDSELGIIPAGWQISRLKDFVEFQKGVEPGRKNYKNNYFDGLIKFLRVGDLGNRKSEIFIEKKFTKEKILNKNDIAITLDGTVGIVKMGLEGCYSTGIRKLIIKKDINSSYLFFLMQSEHIQNIIKAHAKGTTILHAGQSVKYMNFVLPKSKILNIFDEIVGEMISEILILQIKNEILRKTRDLLLPKLISGEIDVENLDINMKGMET